MWHFRTVLHFLLDYFMPVLFYAGLGHKIEEVIYDVDFSITPYETAVLSFGNQSGFGVEYYYCPPYY